VAAETFHRRRGWLTMSARFLTRSLRLRASMLLFALLSVTVGAAVAATMLNLQADVEAKMSRELRRFGPNLILTPLADRLPATLDRDVVRGAAGVEGSPILIASGAVSGPGGTFATAVIGAEFPALRTVNPSWSVAGAWPEGDVSCLAGAALAARAGLAPGAEARVLLAARPVEAGVQPSPGDPGSAGAIVLKVAGVISTGEAEDDQLFVPLAALQAAMALPGRVSLVAYSIDGGTPGVERAARALVAAVPGSAARPLRPIAAAQGLILGKLDRMMVLLTAVVLILSALCLATTLLAMVVEREAEIGLMRSMGAGDGDVVRMFLGEVSLLGLLGGLLGLVLGALGSRLVGMRLFGAAVDPRLEVIPMVLLTALLVCWVAVLVPLRRALTIQPAAALRGE
jgi:putative ABC transport system permease protein